MSRKLIACLASAAVALPLFAATLEPGPELCQTADCSVGSTAVAGDFNGDGLDDVLIGNLLYLNVEGTFATPRNAGLPARNRNAIVTDFNNDGLDDVISRSGGGWAGGGTDHLFLSNGDGTFTERANAGIYSSVTAADVDGDAHLDLIGRDLDRLLVFRNNGGGFFSLAQALPFDNNIGTPGGRPNVAAGDLNRDGFRDLVTAGPDHIYFYFGQEDGQFGPAVKRYAGSNNSAIDMRLADVNGDRHLDLVYHANGIVVLFNDGFGKFHRMASTIVMPDDINAWYSGLEVANVFGSVAQIIVAGNDGTVVTLGVVDGELRELARTNVDVFGPTAHAGRFRERDRIDVLAAGHATREQTRNAAQLVFAEGVIADAPTVASAMRRRALIGGRFTRGVTTTYDLEWNLSCTPPVTTLVVEHEGLFANIVNETPGVKVEMARPGDLALRIEYLVDGKPAVLEGYLVPDGDGYVGRLLPHGAYMFCGSTLVRVRPR